MGFSDHRHNNNHKQQNADHMLRFHFHAPQIHRLHNHHHHHDHGDGGGHHERTNKGSRDIPKGYVAVMVGVEEEEELQRFVVPLIYINHPLFMELLKEAEEEYGFHHDGPITIPCHVDEFRHVQDIIDEETHRRHGHHGHGGDCHRQAGCDGDHHHEYDRDRDSDHHDHQHHFLCFRV